MDDQQYNVKETFRAIVTRLDPDTQLGNIFVKSEELMGDEATEFPFAIRPAYDWGWFVVPDIGEEVEIEVHVGSSTDQVPYETAVTNPDARWRMVRYPSAGGEAPRPPNSLFTATNYGKRRGFATPKGHVFMFDDTDGAEEITLSWTNGSDTTTITIDSQGQVVVTAPQVIFNSDGDADQDAVRGNDLLSYLVSTLKVAFDAHVHPTAFGPSGPPTTPLTAATASLLTTNVRLK